MKIFLQANETLLEEGIKTVFAMGLKKVLYK